MTHESHLARRAEDTAHRAARLRAEAHGVTTLVGHQDRLDRLAVVEAEEEFLGESIAAGDFLYELQRVQRIRLSLTHRPIDPATQGWEKIAGTQVRYRITMQRAPQHGGMVRIDAICREGFPEGGKVEVVQGKARKGRVIGR